MYDERDVRSDPRNRPPRKPDVPAESVAETNDGRVDSDDGGDAHVVPYRRTKTTELMDAPKKRSPKEHQKDEVRCVNNQIKLFVGGGSSFNQYIVSFIRPHKMTIWMLYYFGHSFFFSVVPPDYGLVDGPGF